MKHPVFIPSKGRPSDSYLMGQLRASDREWWYVVEPQDEDAYRAITDRLMVLPKNDGGIAFVRQWLLDYNRERGQWFWMIDDDITQFYHTVNGRNQKSTMEDALGRVEAVVAKNPEAIGQASLEYQQVAWAAKKRVKWNYHCDVCVLVNPKVSARYRSEVELKEDRDFTLQIQATGLRTVTILDYSFACPTTGSKAGGLQDVYKQSGKERQSVMRMCELWPGVCSVTYKKDGRIEVKVDWKVFR